MKTTGPPRYSPKSNQRNPFKRHRSITKRTVLKMLAVMENQQPAEPTPNSVADKNSVASPESTEKVKEFLASGRTGRRNALPNILQEQTLDTSELPKQFQNLTTTEPKCKTCRDAPGPSNASS